jgi:23S rRNA pseudouridine2605 synthase
MAPMRLQKFLAQAGISSRRKAEALITAGRVQVNNAPVTQLGTKVDPESDVVTVDGKLVGVGGEAQYYLLYKPTGCVTTMKDPQGRPTVAEYLTGIRGRVFPVGRLDFDAEGALLFTSDGDLANKLAHPRYGHRRVYLVKVKGDPAPEKLIRMREGVRLEDGPAKALTCVVHEQTDKNTWLRVEVGEGRFHLVKRLCESVGLLVQRLFRPEFAGVSVQGLRPGRYRALTDEEVKMVKALVKGGAEAEAAKPTGPRKFPKAARRHGHGPPKPREG